MMNETKIVTIEVKEISLEEMALKLGIKPNALFNYEKEGEMQIISINPGGLFKMKQNK